MGATRDRCRLTKRQRSWQARLRSGGLRVPAAVIREAGEQIDRYIKRWLSRLLIVRRSRSGNVLVSRVGKERAAWPMANRKERRSPR